MKTFKMTLEYHGGGFHGWQRQEGLRTVQGVVEGALSLLLGQHVEISGSGRTDKGVHARGQVASFACETKIPTENLPVALNNLLPADVRILSVQEVSPDFDARFSAKRKTYEYAVQIGGSRSALEFDRLGLFPFEVSTKKMKHAAKMLVGTHNFRAFSASGATTKTFERTIFKIEISRKKNIVKFRVTGNGFLYNMVRILVGTLLEVGRGTLSEEKIALALENGDRALLGKTMEPCGLTLLSVEYEN